MVVPAKPKKRLDAYAKPVTKAIDLRRLYGTIKIN
jgi:hypothetical protein